MKVGDYFKLHGKKHQILVLPENENELVICKCIPCNVTVKLKRERIVIE